MVPSGTFRTYDTYTTSNKYVLWFIWKLSGRLRFPLFKNKNHSCESFARKFEHAIKSGEGWGHLPLGRWVGVGSGVGGYVLVRVQRTASQFVLLVH